MSEHYSWVAYPRKPFAPLHIPSSVLWEPDALEHAERVAPGRGPWRVERLPFDGAHLAARARTPVLPDAFGNDHPQYLRFMADIYDSHDW
jgi:hypothetical protein